MLLFIIRVKRELKRVYRNGCRYNQRLNVETGERMPPKPPKRTKQSSITSIGFPLLQKPGEMCVGRQIKVPGSYWKGRIHGVDGQDSRETGGSASDRIFFMKYPMPFLQHWYGTFAPAQEDTSKAVVFKYWTLVSDDLIPHDRNCGQYTATFKCNIEVAGKVCGAERSLIHCKDKTVSTTNHKN
jgi:hypothetical protein